jgi:hypothetical protein
LPDRLDHLLIGNHHAPHQGVRAWLHSSWAWMSPVIVAAPRQVYPTGHRLDVPLILKGLDHGYLLLGWIGVFFSKALFTSNSSA